MQSLSPSPMRKLSRAAALELPVRGPFLFRFAACASLILLLCHWQDRAYAAEHRGNGGAAASVGLTTVRQVHSLSPEAAAAHPSLHLKGVVTALSTWPNSFFFQDATGGISVENAHPTGAFDGAAVEIEGQASPGLFAPVVKAQQVRVLGPGKLPPAPLFTYSGLKGGSQDSQWIAVRGIVRSVKVITRWNRPVLVLMVETEGDLITVHISHFTEQELAGLVDATILLRGVCFTDFNDKRQFVGVGLHLPSMKFLKVEKAAVADPFSLPVARVRNLLQFHPGVTAGHRVQIAGTVTYSDPGHTLYVQDGTDGVLVETEQATPVHIGDKVAAVGFPAAGSYSPILRNAIFRPLDGTEYIQAAAIHANDFLDPGQFIIAPYDAQLVVLQGELIERTTRLHETSWLLRDGDKHFEAILRHVPRAALPAIELGSKIAVTGIFSVQVDDSHEPASFRVLLRGPADLVVVKRAAWWTSRRALWVAVAMLMAALAATLWSIVLRRTVRRQTQMLRESEERFRNQAQHDTLTGLKSRSFLEEQLQQEIADAEGRGEILGVLMVDLDRFKEVNDTHGHACGDELLCLMASRLRSCVRKGDLVARMGGDEFVILLKDLGGSSAAEAIGAKVVAAVSEPAILSGCEVLISASVGACLYPEGGSTCEDLLQNVDAAMYLAKTSGRNSCFMYAGMIEGMASRSL